MSEGRRVGGARVPAARRPPARTGRRSSCAAVRGGRSTTSDRARHPRPRASRSLVFVAAHPAVHGAAVAARGDDLRRARAASPTRSSPRSRRSASPGCRPSTSRPTSRRSARSIIFIGVNIGGMGVLTLASILGPRDLEAPRAARQAHRGERHQPAARARRTGQRGPDRAPRRGRPAAAHGRAVDPRDRGGHRRCCSTRRCIIGGDRPARGAVGGAVLRRDGVHEHRLHARTPAGSRRSPTTTSC